MRGGSRVRRATPWFVVAVLLWGGIAVSVYASLPPKPDALSSLFPTAPGTTWIYDLSVDGEPRGRFVRQVAKELTYRDSEKAYLVRMGTLSSFSAGKGADLEQILGRRGDAVVELEERSKGEAWLAFSTPVPLLRQPFDVGGSWRADTQEITPITTTVVDREDVDVFGESRSGCVHLRHEVDDAPPGEFKEEWYCRGLGLTRIKEVAGGTTYERTLVGFHASGTNLGEVLPVSSEGEEQQDPGRSNVSSAGDLDPTTPLWAWGRRFDSLFAPSGEGTRLVLGENDGTVTAIDTGTGATLWRAAVPGASISPPGVGRGVAVITSSDKSVTAFDLGTGLALWSVKAADVVKLQPLITSSEVVTAGEDGVLRAWDLEDGRQVWSKQFSGSFAGPPAAAAEGIAVATEGDGAVLLSNDGAVRWTASLQGGALQGPAVEGDLLVVADDSGGIYGLRTETGSEAWATFLDADISNPPAITEENVIAVSGGGRILAFDRGSGEIEWEGGVPQPVVGAPLVMGDQVAVLTKDARINVFARGGTDLGAADVLRGAGGTVLRSQSPPALVGEVWVVPVQSPNYGDMYLGFSSEDSPYPGLPLGVSPPIQLPDIPTAAPILQGDSILFPGLEGGWWNANRDGTSIPLSPGAEFGSDAVVADDVLLARTEAELSALPLSGGPPRWTYPLGDSGPSDAPVVADGRVVVSTSEGLAALDLSDGTEIWTHEASHPWGRFAPAVLSDGDLLYADEGLVRLDAETGDRVFKVGDFEGTARPAVSGDVAVVTWFPPGEQAGKGFVAAVDLSRSEVLWRKKARPVLGVGPAISGEIVVIAEPKGARALDLRTGSPLWSVPLATPPALEPIILGERVILVEQGTDQDLIHRDQRAIVLDTVSGRFQGDLEVGSIFNFGVSSGLVEVPMKKDLLFFDIGAP